MQINLPENIRFKYQNHCYQFNEIASTNDFLLELAKTQAISHAVCIADSQTAGRGRNDRAWYSPRGQNLYFSQLLQIPVHSSFEGVTLVVGIIVCQLLREIVCLPCMLKWPNDIYFKHKKLAGILTEMTVDSHGNRYMVVGIGLNVNLPEEMSIVFPDAIDLKSQGIELDMSVFITKLIIHLDQSLTNVMQTGWYCYYNLWQQYDLLYNQPVFVKTLTQQLKGIAQGVGQNGHLHVLIDGELQTFSAADVSIRLNV